MSNNDESKRSRASSKDSFFAKMEADIEGLDSQRVHGKDLPKSDLPQEPQFQRFNSDLAEVRLK